jgi:hypothetical protein
MITFKKTLAMVSLFALLVSRNLTTGAELEATAAHAAESDGLHVKTNIQFDNTERLSIYNSLLEVADASGAGNDLGPISFIISKVDMDDMTAKNLSTIPIIMPALAQLNEPEEDKVLSKRKKNFSKLAKTIILASKNLRKKMGEAKIETTSPAEEEVATTTTTPFNMDTFCQFKEDDTYADPTDCQNFVICYSGKSFKTKCAAGTLYNHFHKDCDFESKGKILAKEI